MSFLPECPRWLAAGVIGAMALCARPGAAQAGDDAKASALAEAAAVEAHRGQRRAAIDHYEEAFAASPRRELLCAIATQYAALAGAGDPRDASLAIAYEEYCLYGASEPERAAITARLANLRELRRKLSPPPATTLPEGAATLQVHSPALTAGGYVMIAFGVASVVSGLAMFQVATSHDCYDCYRVMIATPLLLHGAGCVAGGIAMAVVGKREIPVPAPVLLVLPPATSQRGTAPLGLALVGRF
jgi:hypothetical protein